MKAVLSYSCITAGTSILLTFAGLFALNASAQTCASPPSGLIGWWPAEGDGQDLAGGNNGNLVNGASFATGTVGQGFQFDGNHAAVVVSNSPAYHVQDFTIEAWIQRASTTIASSYPGGGEIFGFGYAGYCLGMLDDGGFFLTKVGIDNVTLVNGITDMSFHHVAVTKSGTNVVFYIDGQGFQMPPYQTFYDFSSPPAIGARGDNLFNSFLGVIDEVSLYDRPLTASEILSLYSAGGAGKCTAPTPPVITAQPTNQSVLAGANVTFSVAASGSPPLVYQWLFNGATLSGATLSQLNFPTANAANAGSYQVVITNFSGAVTSDVAILAVGTPPTITQQPQNLGIVPGDTALFVVAASGTPPLSFQWRFNGSNLSGSTSYSLLLTNVQIANVGSYVAVITNAFGSITSSPATLALNVPPTISNQPASLSLPAGANATFAVGAIGPRVLSYQWRFVGTNLPGASSSVLALNDVQTNQAGPYSVSVSNAYGSVTSTLALLTITNPICVPAPSGMLGWWQAENSADDSVTGRTNTLLGNATFASGKIGRAFAFDGQGDGISLGNSPEFQLQNFTIEAWVKRASLTQASSGGADGLVFSYGSGGYGFGLSPNGHAFLTQIDINNVVSSFQITDTNWHHVALSKAGTKVIFYLDGLGYPAPAYNATFYFSSPLAIGFRADNHGSSFLGFVDEVAFFNRPLASNEIASIYYGTSRGKCPIAPTWAQQPTSQTVTLGSNASFAAAAAGSRPIAFQWSFNGVPLDKATNSTLALNAVSFFDAGAYSVFASNAAGFIASSNALLAIRPAPLLANGSYESGNLSGWLVTDISAPLLPVRIASQGFNSGFGFFSAAPIDGNFCLVEGFDGDGPGRIRVAVDVVLPPSPVTLTFKYRAAWDMLNYAGSSLPRTFGVTIEPYGGAAFQTTTLLTAAPGTANFDTGNLPAVIDLSAFFNRAIRISFDANIPESFTGPGFLMLDNVVLTSFPTPPLLISKSGSQVTLTWPAAFSNYVALTTSNFSASPIWTPIDTNLIVRAPTNTSLTLPIAPGRQFYRIRSP
jgi:Immunoglobulin I-set domain.